MHDIIYKSCFKEKYIEGLTLKEIKGMMGISSLTNSFKKDRKSFLGTAKTNTVLHGIKINESNDYFDFIFYSKPTDDDSVKVVSIPDGNFSNDNKYTLILRIEDFFKLLDTSPTNINELSKKLQFKEITEIFNIAEWKVYSNDPSWLFQGMAYRATQLDASIIPVSIQDLVWGSRHSNSSGVSILSKHLSQLIDSIGFFYLQMVQKIRSKFNL